jgi:uncharacterized membrane protein
MDFEIKVQIDQPVKDVFRYVSNFSNHKEMIMANIDSKQTSEGPVQVGTTMRNVAKFMGIKMEENFVVTEFIPDKVIAKESVPGSSFVTGDKMTFEDVAGGTLLTCHVYAKLTGVLKLFDGYLGKKVRQSLTEDMNRMKEREFTTINPLKISE